MVSSCRTWRFVAGWEPGRSLGFSRLGAFLRTHGPLADGKCGNGWKLQGPRPKAMVDVADLYSLQVRFELIKPSGDMWMVAALMAWDTSELQKGAANLTHKGAYVNQGRG